MNSLRIKFWLLVECAIVLLLPGRALTFLDGVPLNQPLEYALVVVLLVNVFLYVLNAYGVPSSENNLRFQLDKGLFRRIAEFANRRHLWVFGFILFLRLFLFSTNYRYPLNAFSACYRVTPETATPWPCVLNADNIFRFGDCTHLEKRFKWDSRGDYENWYRNDLSLLHDKGLRVQLSGYIRSPADRTLKIRYAGPVDVTIGDVSFKESPPEPAEKLLTLPEGPSPVPVRADLQVTPHSYIEIQHAPQKGDWRTLTAVTPVPFTLQTWLMGLAVCTVAIYLLVVGALFLCQIVVNVSFDTKLLLPVLFIPILFSSLPALGVTSFIALCYLLALYEKRTRGRVHYLNWVLIIGITYCVYQYMTVPAGRHLIIRLSQDDPITYDTLGREVLKYRSLKAGEAPFHYQPGFRYYMALILATFGEYNYFPRVMFLFFYLFSVWLLFVWLDNRIEPTLLSRFSSLISVVLLAKAGTPFVSFNLSEGLTWIFIMAALMAFFSPARWTHLNGFHYDARRLPFWAAPLFSACLALTAVIRPNQVTGSIAIYLVGMGVYAFSKRREKGMWPALFFNLALYGFVLLLPLFHNLYYGHKFLLFSDGSTDSVYTLIFPPSRFLELGSSADAREKLGYQLSHLMVLRKWLCLRMSILTTTAFNLVLGIFIFASIRAIRRGAWRLAAVAYFVVLGYAGVHVFYLADNYYPRHILAIYLMIAAFNVPLLCKPSLNGFAHR